MKIVNTIEKKGGVRTFTFHHLVKGLKHVIDVEAINEKNATTKAWKEVSNRYKLIKTHK